MTNYQIEKEYKIKIDAKTYKKILNILNIDETLIQTNYYYSAPINSGIRIREANNNYTFTLKRYINHKVEEYNIKLNKNDINDPKVKELLDSFNIKNINYLGKLKTTRANIHYPKAIMSIDKSEYLGITDYEIEYELLNPNIDDLKHLKEVLEMLNIDCVFSSDTKYERFNKASNAKAAIFCANGLEECEALMVFDLLKRAGILVDLVSVEDDLNIVSSHNLQFKCDKYFDDIDKDAYDILILPGGLKGTDTLSKNEELISLIKKYKEEDKLIAAICAAPSIFVKNGLVKDEKFTVYPGFESGLTSSAKKTYCDDNVITAKGVGASIDFAYAIITYLLGKDKAEAVLKEIQY